LKQQDDDKPFRVGWGSILNKYLKDLPSGYTKYYFFEFTKGYVTYRRLATTPDSEAKTIKLVEVDTVLEDRLLMELFGKNDVMDLSMKDLKLPVNPGKTLGKAKLKSLAEKYFSIPMTYRQFYPKYNIKKVKEKPAVSLNNNELESAKRKLDKSDKSKNKKRRVGRPRRQPKIPTGVRSITTYFRSE